MSDHPVTSPESSYPAASTARLLNLSEALFYTSATLAGGCLGAAFLLIERREAALLALALGGGWALWMKLFILREKPRSLASGPANLFFAGLVILAGWSVVSGALWQLGLLSLAASLAAWDLDSFMQRTAHMRVVEKPDAHTAAALQRSHLRFLVITLGVGILLALLAVTLASALRLQPGLWLALGLGAAVVIGLIWLARVVMVQGGKRQA